MRKAAEQRKVGAITGDEGKGHPELDKPIRDDQTGLRAKPDIEQREMWCPLRDHGQRFVDIGRRTHGLDPKAENGLLEIHRDDGVVLDDEHIVRHRAESRDRLTLGRQRFHDLATDALEAALIG